MIDPNVLSLPEWLRQFGMLVGGDLPMDEAVERLRAYGGALNADFAPSVFTAESARHVARHANAKGFFPRYAEVCAALIAWAKANPPSTKALPGPTAAAPDRPGAGHWHGFIAAKLVAGHNRAHLLSLAKSYASPAELRGIMTAFYPEEAPLTGPKGGGRAEEYDPEYLRVQIAKLERDPPDAFRTIAVNLLVTMLERHRPDLLAEVGDQLRALITPRKPFRSAYLRPSHDAPPVDAAPQPLREVPLKPEAMLAQLERLIATGQATEATRTRIEALRRQITAAAITPQQEAAE